MNCNNIIYINKDKKGNYINYYGNRLYLNKYKSEKFVNKFGRKLYFNNFGAFTLTKDVIQNKNNLLSILPDNIIDMIDEYFNVIKVDVILEPMLNLRPNFGLKNAFTHLTKNRYNLNMLIRWCNKVFNFFNLNKTGINPYKCIFEPNYTNYTIKASVYFDDIFVPCSKIQEYINKYLKNPLGNDPEGYSYSYRYPVFFTMTKGDDRNIVSLFKEPKDYESFSQYFLFFNIKNIESINIVNNDIFVSKKKDCEK